MVRWKHGPGGLWRGGMGGRERRSGRTGGRARRRRLWQGRHGCGWSAHLFDVNRCYRDGGGPLASADGGSRFTRLTGGGGTGGSLVLVRWKHGPGGLWRGGMGGRERRSGRTGGRARRRRLWQGRHGCGWSAHLFDVNRCYRDGGGPLASADGGSRFTRLTGGGGTGGSLVLAICIVVRNRHGVACWHTHTHTVCVCLSECIHSSTVPHVAVDGHHLMPV